MDPSERIRVRRTVFSDGERYPLLVDERGVPLWYPTLFVTTRVRNASKAPNTLEAVSRAVRMALLWAEEACVDLEWRFAKGEVLFDSELEAIRRFTQTRADVGREPGKVVSLPRKREGSRGGFQVQEHRVTGETQYIRLTYIAEYLEWLARRLVEREARHISAEIAKDIQRMGQGLRSRRPLKKGRNREGARKGLTEEQKEVLFQLVEPGSERNPFTPEVQLRNHLIVQLLYNVGVRHGELLGLRIGKDLDLNGNNLRVARRHDDPDDPRTQQPVTKTRDREVPLGNELARQISDYLLHSRRKVPGANRHDFLIVTHQKGPYQGAPISSSGLEKLFKRLKSVEPDLLSDLTPHQFRHDWKNRFSNRADREKWSFPAEEKMRSYIMGWKEGSGTSAVYTKRYTERKAKEVALRLQEPLRSGETNE